MPVKEAPSAEPPVVQLNAQKNPHIDVHQPTSVECYPESKRGAVTFDNNGSYDVVVTIMPYGLFKCSDVLVKAKHSVTKPVKTERCNGLYSVRSAALVSEVLAGSESTVTTQEKAGSDPKDIIVP